jgi:hypothetical protein
MFFSMIRTLRFARTSIQHLRQCRQVLYQQFKVRCNENRLLLLTNILDYFFLIIRNSSGMKKIDYILVPFQPFIIYIYIYSIPHFLQVALYIYIYMCVCVCVLHTLHSYTHTHTHTYVTYITPMHSRCRAGWAPVCLKGLGSVQVFMILQLSRK